MRILFAFLLTPGLHTALPGPDSVQRATYVVPLPPTVLAATPFTVTAALHRSLFQQNVEPAIAQAASSRPTTAGLIVLMPAATGSVLLVVDVTVDRKAGIAAGAATLLARLILWAVLPKPVGRPSDHDAPPTTTPRRRRR
ncbi:DUF6328 family protein, partial [Streptomyces europaeiscabiei]|uniref:DUF6328 family protein n=1 Tax=Streptomyces europaeiscabiei TaxID=146819 RepID=UPI00069C8C44